MRMTAAMATGVGAFALTTAAGAVFADPGDGFEPVQMAHAAQPQPVRSKTAVRGYQSPFLPHLPEDPAHSPAPSAPSAPPVAAPTPKTEAGAERCEKAIAAAEKKYGLPPFILRAISITESGRNHKPSPWAMNIMGKSHFAAGPDEVEAIVNHYGPGSSIDIGCAQVNLRWHARRFDDWRSLIDPEVNADYAAFYLLELRRETGSWGRAVSAYHSRTNWRGANYACTVSRNYGRLLGDNRKGCGPDIDALTAYLTERNMG